MPDGQLVVGKTSPAPHQGHTNVRIADTPVLQPNGLQLTVLLSSRGLTLLRSTQVELSLSVPSASSLRALKIRIVRKIFHQTLIYLWR
jgi:hypothetical protein